MQQSPVKPHLSPSYFLLISFSECSWVVVPPQFYVLQDINMLDTPSGL